MVNHYKRTAATKVKESIHLQKAADANLPTATNQTEPAARRFAPGSSFELHKWPDLEIRFLSDERIHVQSGQFTETRNYAEFGFEDGRTKKPNLAWVTLRVLAQREGTIDQPVTVRIGATSKNGYKRYEGISGSTSNWMAILYPSLTELGTKHHSR